MSVQVTGLVLTTNIYVREITLVKVATIGAGTAYPSGAHEFTPGFQWCSCYLIVSFMCNVLQIVVCPFIFFLLAIVLSVLPRFTDSDYPFWHLQTLFIPPLPGGEGGILFYLYPSVRPSVRPRYFSLHFSQQLLMTQI